MQLENSVYFSICYFHNGIQIEHHELYASVNSPIPFHLIILPHVSRYSDSYKLSETKHGSIAAFPYPCTLIKHCAVVVCVTQTCSKSINLTYWMSLHCGKLSVMNMETITV